MNRGLNMTLDIIIHTVFGCRLCQTSLVNGRTVSVSKTHTFRVSQVSQVRTSLPSESLLNAVLPTKMYPVGASVHISTQPTVLCSPIHYLSNRPKVMPMLLKLRYLAMFVCHFLADPHWWQFRSVGELPTYLDELTLPIVVPDGWNIAHLMTCRMAQTLRRYKKSLKCSAAFHR